MLFGNLVENDALSDLCDFVCFLIVLFGNLVEIWRMMPFLVFMIFNCDFVCFLIVLFGNLVENDALSDLCDFRS